MTVTKRTTAYTVLQYICISLTLIFSIAILTCAVDAQDAFTQATQIHAWWTPTFGGLLDATALKAATGTSSIVLVMTVLLGAVTLFSTLKRRSDAVNTNKRYECATRILELTIPALLALLVLGDLIFVSHHERSQKQAKYISVETWTCTWKPKGGHKVAGIPESFSQMCNESRFARWAMLPILFFQLGSIVVNVLASKAQSAAGERPMPPQQMANTSRGIAQGHVGYARSTDSLSEDNISIGDDDKGSWPL